MSAPAIHYYPSAEEQLELMRRYLRGRMYAFFGVITGSAVFDVLVAWWIIHRF